jgi:hypothetical protein
MIACVPDCCVKQSRRDAHTAVSPVNGEARDPPRPRVVIEDAAQGAVSQDKRHSGARHDARPPCRCPINVGDYSRRDRCTFDLESQGVAIRGRAGVVEPWLQEPLAPTPVRVGAASPEGRYNVVPDVGSCQARRNRH